ncbi:DUF397 domain-containing protein [Streptomyces sp. MBT53]|uniref:DUF397 domain-containing protein n=1 Tax=Streptomyces sp. MBT53 TaxID=1488384 RepID=UPI00191206CA|nr:DUF397 domain-containing protein [Streptomyces sp. MBT53]MBK6015633.1 DUF397 domain-containing protein [Streptomyces sp. MBT53]
MNPNTSNTPSLYGLSTEGAKFAAYCGGNLGGENETCVEIAAIPGAVDAFAVRDNKADATGGDLRFTGPELDTWAVEWAQQRGLTV